MDSFENERQKEALKMELQGKVQKLLNSGIPTKDIAEILNAEEFLDIKNFRGKQGDLVQFRVKEFVEKQVGEGNTLKLPDSVEMLHETILPPGSGEIITGDGSGMKELEIIPRTKYLIDLLSKMNISYNLVEGVNAPNMVRGRSYIVFLIPEKNKTVFVNNEEGNSTYIVHGIDTGTDDWRQYSNQTKDELRNFEDEGRVSRVDWTGDPDSWSAKMSAEIEKEYEFKQREIKEDVDFDKEVVSDFGKGEYEVAPEGWFNRFGLLKEIGKGNVWIQNRINKLKENSDWQTDWEREYLDTGRYKRTYYSPEVVAKLKELASEYEIAPDGWFSRSSLAKEIGKSEMWVERWISKLKQSPDWQSDWHKEYLDSISRKITHYSPEAVAKLKEIASEYDSAPGGWFNINTLKKEIDKDASWIKIRINKLKENSDWQVDWEREYLDSSGRKGTHYSPELVAKLKELATQYDTAPEGWVTRGGLIKEIDRSRDWVKRQINKLKENSDWQTDWESEYLESGGQKTTHYSPEVTAKLKEIASEYDSAPGGWFNRISLVKEIGKSDTWIQNQINKLKQSPDWQSDWQKEYLDSSGQKIKYYSPELVAKLKELATQYGTAPTGWLSIFGLNKEVGKSRSWVGKEINKLKQSPDWQSDWQKEYLDSSGQKTTHYSPEVMAKLKEMI